jgi:hypothetical protein
MKRHDLVFSRPISVADLPAPGLDTKVEASPGERASIAREFGLLGLEALIGTYHVDASAGGARVRGEVVARIRQTCVVSLDPFDTELREPVDIAFAAPPEWKETAAGGEITVSLEAEDPPEPLVDGKIDLGAVTLEFLALGIRPYPRKPGVELSSENAEDERPTSPFAVLASYVQKPSTEK